MCLVTQFGTLVTFNYFQSLDPNRSNQNLFSYFSHFVLVDISVRFTSVAVQFSTTLTKTNQLHGQQIELNGKSLQKEQEIGARVQALRGGGNKTACRAVATRSWCSWVPHVSEQGQLQRSLVAREPGGRCAARRSGSALHDSHARPHGCGPLLRSDPEAKRPPRTLRTGIYHHAGAGRQTREPRHEPVELARVERASEEYREREQEQREQ